MSGSEEAKDRVKLEIQTIVVSSCYKNSQELENCKYKYKYKQSLASKAIRGTSQIILICFLKDKRAKK